MPYCRNCGVQMPEDAAFCPHCGATVRLRAQHTLDVRESVLRYIVTGLMGAFLSVMIASLSGIELYFIPSFISSIFIIYMYRIGEFKESLIATFTVYLFADGILGTLVLGHYYVLNQTITFVPRVWDVALYPFNPISAFIASYIGSRISPKRREELVSVPHRREEGPGGVIYKL